MISWNKFACISFTLVMLMLIIPGISEAKKVISVSSGYNHVLALNDDGTVLTWGTNSKGQVGTGSTSDYEEKSYQVPIQGVIAVSAGVDYSLALKNDGTVWAWGNNYKGKLGDGTTQDRYLPVQVKVLSNIIAISAGQNTNLALKNDGTVWAWGDWAFCYGKDLFAGVTFMEPEQVEGIGDVRSLGERGAFAIKNDGTVWAWGINVVSMWGEGQIYYGWLANKSEVMYIPVPFQVEGMANAKEITLCAASGACLKEDGTVWAWGNSHNGQLGDGTFTYDTSSTEVILPPVKVKISDVKQISSQGYHLIALKNDGSVWAWGAYVDGRMAGRPGMAEPAKVNGLSNIIDISSGVLYNIALQNDGTVWGWGINYGNSPVRVIQGSPGSITPTATPVATPVVTPTDTNPTNGTNASPSPTPTGTPAPTQTSGFELTTIIALVSLALVGSLIYSTIKK